MKTPRTHPQGVSHEQRMPPAREDSYRATAKSPGPAACPRCGASYLEGRWSWKHAPEDAQAVTCPACRRIEDDYPGGYLTLQGDFFEAHREEVLRLVESRAAHARAAHPMQRLIGVEEVAGGVLVTTTDAHLARGLGKALHDAYKGRLDLDFGQHENRTRATWER